METFNNLLQAINVEILIISILVITVIRNVGDWFIYNLKPSPKQAQVSTIGWIIGWGALSALIYLYLNN